MKRIPLGKSGEFTLVDDEDYAWLSRWKWKLHSQGYACRTSWDAHSKKWLCILMHRLIADTPAHLQADHINRRRLDNRRCNLRNVTGSVNTRNQGISPRNTSGFRGVTWDKSRGKWQAKTKHQGRWIFLGRFATAVEAGAARADFDNRLADTERAA